jgi:beta-ureidopropionase
VAYRRGQIIAQAPRATDSIVTADLDLDVIRQVRNVWQFYRDRRPESYQTLTAP